MKRSAKSTSKTGKTRKSGGIRMEKKIIAHRRSCDPKGVGLSHYDFAEKKTR